MRRVIRDVATAGAALTLKLVAGGAAMAAGPYVYPQKGQTPDQQSKDSAECSSWAKGQSGVDPSAPPAPAQPGRHA